MVSPNRNANTITGSQDGMEPIAGMPHRAFDPYPFCQIRVSAPQAAAMDRMLRTTALAGSSSERKARASRTKPSTAIRAIISGKLP